MEKEQMKRIGNRIGEARGAEMPPLSQEKTGEKLGTGGVPPGYGPPAVPFKGTGPFPGCPFR